jgi:hypothetical protein
MSDETDGGPVMAVRPRLLPKDGIPVWERFLSSYCRRHHAAVAVRVQSNSDLISSARQSRW